MVTILVVDDDRMVLDYCDHVLSGLSGFQVLRATSGAEAIDTAARHPGPIELLVSDISMPGEIGGIELAERLGSMRPGIRVLLISGYSEQSLSLKEGWQFLAKPFGPFDLIAKTEATLAMGDTTQTWNVSSGIT
jgi:CheY-like chemotaxis protein